MTAKERLAEVLAERDQLRKRLAEQRRAMIVANREDQKNHATIARLKATIVRLQTRRGHPV